MLIFISLCYSKENSCKLWIINITEWKMKCSECISSSVPENYSSDSPELLFEEMVFPINKWK